MGAWVLYGLGSDAVDLPGFVVLTSLGKGGRETTSSAIRSTPGPQATR